MQQGELGDLVEQEMSATSAAVESAAARIEVNKHGFTALADSIPLRSNRLFLIVFSSILSWQRTPPFCFPVQFYAVTKLTSVFFHLHRKC